MSLGVFVVHLLNVSGCLCISFVTCLWMSLYVFVFHLLHVSGWRCMSSYFMCYMSLGVFVCFCISVVTCLWMFLYVLFTFVYHLQPFMFRVYICISPAAVFKERCKDYSTKIIQKLQSSRSSQRRLEHHKVTDLRREDLNIPNKILNFIDVRNFTDGRKICYFIECERGFLRYFCHLTFSIIKLTEILHDVRV